MVTLVGGNNLKSRISYLGNSTFYVETGVRLIFIAM